MTAFSDMPDDFRMAARKAVDSAGGYVSGYHDSALQVALPVDRDACVTMTAALTDLGLVAEDRFTWFPLGSDNPPDSLRHFGTGTAACPKGDRPSYWKYRNFHVS
jgi:hypothetical protein